ncbi:MAG: AAA family ATPase [Rhodococcus sp. (in: high G+C Gram-positive bacteria)]|uniref:AAA family ATPase n=1 Tax=unclassified Rhodococcus (in: high G+C Gram-positive bacteria) TaxID=192944 RepID=UPI000AC286C7|nr:MULTISPECIES: AAA family ATPase [unclassified Rhodococcus (in: high G+C Gram-positive bacteria)]
MTTPISDPVLHLLAGPNGAGKSTFNARVLSPVTHLPFINADEIAHDRWPGDESAHAYEASRVAADLRAEFLSARSSFVTETVFSHESKVELVQFAVSAGYLVTLHVIAIPVETAVARVRNRVDQGGHSVPEAKIRERYDRLWPLLRSAIEMVDRAQVYDNSSARQPFRTIARFDRGNLVGQAEWPTWMPPALRS